MVRAVTDGYADYLRDRFGAGSVGDKFGRRIRLKKIPLGVNTEKFHPATPAERAAARKAFQIQDDEITVLFVGRLSHHGKAHPFPMFHGLAQAARQTGKKVHLVLSGWAANQAIQKAFEEGARHLAHNIRVTFVDGTDPNHRFAVWRAADIFTSLSDNIQETFGLVIVEAMASGLPVVASDWNGYRDLVVDGETGFLVPTLMIRDATADLTSRLLMQEVNYDHYLAECSQAVAVDCAAATQAYGRLISNAELRLTMGLAGRECAEENFAWPRIIHAYEALWQDQERERQDRMKGIGVRSELVQAISDYSRLTPSQTRYPAPEHSFAGYPTRWLDGDSDCLQTVLGAEERLERLLAMPLVNHVAESRCSDAAALRAVLAAGRFPCPLTEMERILTKESVTTSSSCTRTAVRATLAWMLKYDLLRVVNCSSPPRPES
jgi:hypothetical protein